MYQGKIQRGYWIMPTLDERIKKEMEKLEQLKRQKRAVIARENKQAQAIETRQKILAGEALLTVFPEFKEIIPKRTAAENQEAYKPMYYFLHELVTDKEYVSRCKTEAERKLAADKSSKNDNILS
jgi:hypothetical protein